MQVESTWVTGIQRVETDAHGRVGQVLDQEPSKYGSNLDLYLDVSLQAAALTLKQRRGAIVASILKLEYTRNG